MNLTLGEHYRTDAKLGCWLWIKSFRNDCGYGQIGFWEDGRNFTLYAHRVSYEQFVGPIPEGLTLDHLCRNRACIRPEHLEPVTLEENIARSVPHRIHKTHCKHGHSLEDAYLWGKKRPYKACRTCRSQRAKELTQKRKNQRDNLVLS